MPALVRASLLLLPLLLSGCALGLPTAATGGSLVVLQPPSPAPSESGSATGSLPSGSAPAASAREQAVLPMIALSASRFGVPANLVRAVVAQESAFDPAAVSASGAQGLMQLMPDTVKHINSASEVKVLDPFDPADNLAGGTWYLKWVHGQVPSKVLEADRWAFTLAGYNAGIGRVQSLLTGAGSGVAFSAIEAKLPAETRAYVPKVLARWKAYGP
jgi:soluble lytic murein transglycosylase-like protein